MSVALGSTSPRVESSYLSYTNSNSSSRPSFIQASLQHPARDTPERPSPHHIPTANADRVSPLTSPLAESHDRRTHRTPSSQESIHRQHPIVGDLGSNMASPRGSGGQNHDRIDVDMGDDEQSIGEVALELHSHLQPGMPSDVGEGDLMDIAPDPQTLVDSQLAGVQDSMHAPTSDPDQDQAHLNAAQSDGNIPGDATPIVSTSDTLPGPQEIAAGSQEGTLVVAEVPPTSSDTTGADTINTSEQGQPTDPGLQMPGVELASGDPVEDNDNDSDGGSSVDDEHDMWVNRQEDLSGPSEEELQELESAQLEASALDHDHWENMFFEELDDPEYIVREKGRITWTLNRFHGTQADPNKERILRSPSVRIGDYDWNIKIFPRGNEGTDHVSVYIECKKHQSNSGVESPDTEVSPNPSAEKDEEFPWGIAAQIGCVMYNPNEPRVQVNAKSAHHFYNGNPDWGWVRFHGPWDSIHKRRPLQRQALLRNDTLAFTAYIRTIEDYTGTLWWHPSANEVSWDSVAKTGYRGLIAPHSGGSALIAALSSWLHLAPFKDLILDNRVPDVVKSTLTKTLPLFSQLKVLLYAKHSPEPKTSSAISTEGITKAMRWHSWEDIVPPDVIAIWEALRFLLNQESSHIELGHSDVFRDILTLRQQWPPNAFIQGSRTSQPELQSSQKVLDFAQGAGSFTFQEWEGFYGESQSTSYPPLVLQLELHRQAYDVDARRWKKLTHRIDINETVIFNSDSEEQSKKSEYTLYGMIVHSGDLESGDYFSVIRPGGPNSKWVKYSDTRQSDVTYLTRKQAIDAHQGTGNSAEGTDPVAYIVMYVKSDCLSTVLPASLEPWEPSSSIREPLCLPTKHTMDEAENQEILHVKVYNSSVYDRCSGQGVFDVWATDLGDDNISNLHLPSSSTLKDIQRLLVTQFNLAGVPEQCRLWPMNSNLSASRWSPRFEEVSYDSNLQDLIKRFGGCHLWLHVVSIDLIPKALPDETNASPLPEQHDAEPNPPEIESSEGNNTLPGSEAAALLATLDATIAELHPTAIPAGLVEEDVIMGGMQEGAAETLLHTSDVPLSVDMGGTQEDPTQSLHPPPDVFVVVDVGGTQQNSTTYIPPPPDVSPPAAAPSVTAQAKPSDLLFFVKAFDAQAQKLTRLGGHLASRKDKVGEVLERLQLMSPEKSYYLFSEEAGDIMQPNLKPRHTFDAENLACGAVIVISERLPPAETKAIEARGDCADIVEYYAYLTSTLHPVWRQDHYLKFYFGSSYFDMALSRGHPHGHCVNIDMYGNAYSGNFIAGEKSGHGTMKYANGDTYTGNWEAELPEGQGTMVYGTTGNRYEGGWKKGRRHGKGTMHFEVADEELQLCKICFEQEMDALFYRCGHVVACEECARQVKDCPVCRRGVDGVVRIWKTT